MPSWMSEMSNEGNISVDGHRIRTSHQIKDQKYARFVITWLGGIVILMWLFVKYSGMRGYCLFQTEVLNILSYAVLQGMYVYRWTARYNVITKTESFFDLMVYQSLAVIIGSCMALEFASLWLNIEFIYGIISCFLNRCHTIDHW